MYEAALSWASWSALMRIGPRAVWEEIKIDDYPNTPTAECSLSKEMKIELRKKENVKSAL